MIIFLKTDSPICQVSVQSADGTKADYEWRADRGLAKGLMTYLEECLAKSDASWPDVTALVVFQGPGSFTGLRIGATVANTIAYAQAIVVVGEMGEDWQRRGEARVAAGEDDQIVLPEYDRPARITQPRK